ncbi:MAG: TolB family protein [Solirubrobacteraceae bacterium]
MLATLIGGGVLGEISSALAGPSLQRTVRVRWAKTVNPDAASRSPSLAADARRVAFASDATNLTPHEDSNEQRDVFVYDQGSGELRNVSLGPGGKPANGRSDEPVLSGDGKVMAFVSSATNLAPDDANGARDVFAAVPGAVDPARVSTGAGGVEADGPSMEPDLSRDGRLLVFSSDATNLVPGDDNRRTDVFVRDLRSGRIALVSSARGKSGSAAGDSTAPAISPDGRYVSFTSTADDIARGDAKGRPDIFVRDLLAGRTAHVSVSRRGGRNAGRDSVLTSDISRNGRYVVFSSDARNLIRRDRNRRSDVFVRDRKARTTRRVSVSATDEEVGGDSYAPTITPDGRFVAFASRARNVVPESARGEDVYVRDMRRHTTMLASVSSKGRPRGRERGPRRRQRPAISADGSTVAFTTSASNLVGRDTNRAADIFLRRMSPAAAAIASRRVGVQDGRVVIRFRSADRAAGPLRCRLDGGPPTLCPLEGTVLPRLKRGRHTLRALAGAPGSFYASRAIVIRVTVRKGRAVVSVRNPGDGF